MMAESLLTPSGITLSSLKGNTASKQRMRERHKNKLKQQCTWKYPADQESAFYIRAISNNTERNGVSDLFQQLKVKRNNWLENVLWLILAVFSFSVLKQKQDALYSSLARFHSESLSCLPSLNPTGLWQMAACPWASFCSRFLSVNGSFFLLLSPKCMFMGVIWILGFFSVLLYEALWGNSWCDLVHNE